MKTLTILFAAAMLSTATQAAPFAKGDPGIGKTLHDKACTSCHAGMFGGDGSRIYTRADRKTRTAQQLAARIAGCNANTGAGWFPEDEAHVAAWLNQQYYKFK
ncbi:MAG: cytochrome c [Gammaproteobacteria bacterium]|nr:cytochrome c [Gammaproteobacteria bacterium]MBU1407311.1 cytochrome c [Gammaproteobacteria bacterium]MBU1531424.1 cytochrome c [Gammaproteobacteria bacterium]